jgi:hypothetical protein
MRGPGKTPIPLRALGAALVLLISLPGIAHAADGTGSDCSAHSSAPCWRSFELPGGAGHMHYYASGAGSPPRSALVVMHGHPRDATRSFDAGLRAVARAGLQADTLVVAPLYQVPEDQARHCGSPGVPLARTGDAVWTCGGWLAGDLSTGPNPMGAFAALDALVVELSREWPSLRTVTLAGFSAGAQMLQHSVGFAADPPDGVTLRYVIADPGSWLYFDPVRPLPRQDGHEVGWDTCGDGAAFAGGCSFTFRPPPTGETCATYDHWKYGVRGLPSYLGRSAAEARSRYAAAQIAYIEGALDSSAGRGTYFGILDKSCGAMLQGPFRLQRGAAYVAYEEAVVTPGRRRQLVVVPGCAHDVSCVLPSEVARQVLFPMK